MIDTLRAARDKTVCERAYFDRRAAWAQLGVG